MKKYFLLISILLIIIQINSFAQVSKDLMKANYLYHHYAFNEAIEYYEKVVPEVNDPVVEARLGDCYRLTKDMEKAVECYKKAYNMKGCPEYIKLHYAQVLMTLTKYKDAHAVLKEYQMAYPKDRRIANMISSCEKAEQMSAEIPHGTIFFQAFNTDGMEFGPAIRKKELVFTTDTILVGTGTKHKEDKWTGEPFFQMYSVDCDDEGRCTHHLKKISKKVNTKYHDGPCSFTADGSKMYFTRTNHNLDMLNKGPVADKNDVVHLQILIASEFDEEKGDYKKVKRFSHNSHTHSTAHPTVSVDGKHMVFSSDIPGGEGGTDLYICSLDDKGKWSKPVNLGKTVNTEGDEMFPFLEGDTILYFSSNGLVGLGGLDIYKSRWNKKTNALSAPENIGVPVNSSYDDMSFILKDYGNGYFASNRPDMKAGDNIYSYKRQSIYLLIKVRDASTGKFLPGSFVELKRNEEKSSFTGDENGSVLTQASPQTAYIINVNKIGYNSAQVALSTHQAVGISDTIERIIDLNPNFKLTYQAIILEEKTKKPIDEPALVFIENEGSKTDTFQLKTAEVFSKDLEINKVYHVYGLKRNYYGNERFVSTKDMNITMGSTTIFDTIYMKKLQVGGVYKIDDIYYDYDKATIREDAKQALDRLLELLNQYPQMHIQLNSHTDCRGSEKYNYKLSNDRAHSVVMYLLERGISLDRLQYKGYGESAPVNKCICEQCTEEQHQNNRRTEFKITSM